jgi:hypothetical protein
MRDWRPPVGLVAFLLLGVIAAAGEARRAARHWSGSESAGPPAGGSHPVPRRRREGDASASFRTIAAQLAAGGAFDTRCFRAGAQLEEEICF